MLIEGLYSIATFEQNDGELDATILINAAHDVFKGHFPGNPVMPGVCMIQIVKELTEKAVGKNLFLSVSSNVKFMAIINPETNSSLKLNIKIKEDQDIIKVKNITSFDDTVALKLNTTFKIIA